MLEAIPKSKNDGVLFCTLSRAERKPIDDLRLEVQIGLSGIGDRVKDRHLVATLDESEREASREDLSSPPLPRRKAVGHLQDSHATSLPRELSSEAPPQTFRQAGLRARRFTVHGRRVGKIGFGVHATAGARR